MAVNIRRLEIINGSNVSPGDELEYTIYFISTGDSPAKNVLFGDGFARRLHRVPENVTFIPTAFNSNPPQNYRELEVGLWEETRLLRLSHISTR